MNTYRIVRSRRLTLRRLMFAIAILAMGLAAVRPGNTLGVIAACIVFLSTIRTVRIMRGRESSGSAFSVSRWFHAGLDSIPPLPLLLSLSGVQCLVHVAVALATRSREG